MDKNPNKQNESLNIAKNLSINPLPSANQLSREHMYVLTHRPFYLTLYYPFHHLYLKINPDLRRFLESLEINEFTKVIEHLDEQCNNRALVVFQNNKKLYDKLVNEVIKAQIESEIEYYKVNNKLLDLDTL